MAQITSQIQKLVSTNSLSALAMMTTYSDFLEQDIKCDVCGVGHSRVGLNIYSIHFGVNLLRIGYICTKCRACDQLIIMERHGQYVESRCDKCAKDTFCAYIQVLRCSPARLPAQRMDFVVYDCSFEIVYALMLCWMCKPSAKKIIK